MLERSCGIYSFPGSGFIGSIFSRQSSLATLLSAWPACRLKCVLNRYYTHLDHHRRKMFGTERDGEYLPLASLSPLLIVVYLSQCLWVPPPAVVRFSILTPLTWICPPLRRWVYKHASSLVMDPSYIRPAPIVTSLRKIRLQELGCFLYLLVCLIIPLYFLHRWPIPLVIQAYVTGIVLVLMNCLRTLASHRWSSEGKEVTFVEQMLDSVTMDNDSPLAVLLNPVGLRYHATHHLFPSMPYHNIRAAHKRLLARLPDDKTRCRAFVTGLSGWSGSTKTVVLAVMPTRRGTPGGCSNSSRT
jgi:fatty acid desaturase